jgi:hypothetical protein
MSKLSEPALAEFERRQRKQEWRSRLGTYFMGVAIGFVLLGLLWVGRSRATGSGTPGPAGVTPPTVPGATTPATAPTTAPALPSVTK